MSRQILYAVTTVESGKHTYVEADIDEVRSFLSGMDHLVCSPVGDGKVKITKLKAERKSLIGLVRGHLDKYDGTPVTLVDVDPQQLRNAVSRYNKDNCTEFSVRTISKDTLEVCSHRIEDYAVVSMEQYEEFRREMMERVDTVFRKVRQEGSDAVEHVDTIDEITDVEFEEGNDNPTQSMKDEFGVCIECGDEFYKQADSQLCADCLNDLV